MRAEQRFSAAVLADRAAAAGVSYPESVLGSLVAALRAGKHVVLTGAPGTGKTTLAALVADMGREALACGGHVLATATSAWTVDDTIGASVESSEGAVFRPGVVVDAIASGRWLIVDELNRADVDRSFGELFTVLSGQSVVLAHRRNPFAHQLSIVPFGCEVPPDTEPIHVGQSWRIIATMNTADRGLLFTLSRAVMRRFAFVHVGTPDDDIVRSLLEGPGAIVADLLPIREVQDIGPAMFLDAADYAAMRLRDRAGRSLVLLEAFGAYVLPQLEPLGEDDQIRLLAVLDGALAEPEQAAARALLADFGLLGAAPVELV